MQWHDKVPICFRASNVSLSNIVDFGHEKNTKQHNKTTYLPVTESTILVYLILLTLGR